MSYTRGSMYYWIALELTASSLLYEDSIGNLNIQLTVCKLLGVIFLPQGRKTRNEWVHN